MSDKIQVYLFRNEDAEILSDKEGNTINDTIKFLQDIKQKVPAKYREQVRLSLSPHYSGVDLNVFYFRDKTEEEIREDQYNKRVADERKLQKKKKQLEKLQTELGLKT